MPEHKGQFVIFKFVAIPRLSVYYLFAIAACAAASLAIGTLNGEHDT